MASSLCSSDTALPLVLGIGACALDHLYLVEAFHAEEIVQAAIEDQLSLGGPVASALATMATMTRLDCSQGSQPHSSYRYLIFDHLGDDATGRSTLAALQAKGIDTSLISVHPHYQSHRAHILVRQSDGARQITYLPGTSPEPSADQLEQSWKELPSAPVLVHCNGRHLDACLHAFQLAEPEATLTSFDGGAHRYRPELKPLYTQADLCILSHHFALKATGETEPTRQLQALAALHRKASPLLGVTQGLEGSWIFHQDHIHHQPALTSVLTKDTTGCGDAYHGGYLLAHLQGKEPAACALAGAEAARDISLRLGSS